MQSFEDPPFYPNTMSRGNILRGTESTLVTITVNCLSYCHLDDSTTQRCHVLTVEYIKNIVNC